MRKFFLKLVTCLVVSALSLPSFAGVTDSILPFVGASTTAGERGGLGLFAGAARLHCETSWSSCLGYGAHTGHRFSDPSTSFLEVGAGGLLIFLPVYIGAGARFKENDVAGGQLSLATGFFPVFLLVRAYNESSKVSGELSLALFWPLGARPGSKNPS